MKKKVRNNKRKKLKRRKLNALRWLMMPFVLLGLYLMVAFNGLKLYIRNKLNKRGDLQ
jgi:cell division septal protein FtsQ